MANVTISPNMNLTIPTVSLDPGPDWANNINASLVAIDGHDHSPGKGVPITPNGMLISSDLPFNNNNATGLRSVRFQPQGAILTNPTDIGALYEVGVDLWYNDGAGNNIRITQSGSVSGASGTITGLPSGTASAAYNSVSGTFIFQSATNTPANIDVASVILRNFTAGSFGLTLSPPSAMTSSFALTLPNIPATNSVLTIDTAGTISGSIPVSSLTVIPPTIQRFTSGSGTYNTPVGCKYLRISMVGGGASGLQSTASVSFGGVAGTASTFGIDFTAGGGGAPSPLLNVTAAGLGGIASATVGSIVLFAVNGGNGTLYNGRPTGGTSFFGGNGQVARDAINPAIMDAAPLSGSGGAAIQTGNFAAGGGAGAYIYAQINAPLASYPYVVGTGGPSAVNGSSVIVAGAGGGGIIVVEEFY